MSEHLDNVSILIVDDTETNVRLLGHVLKKAGYETMEAFSGQEAISQVKKQQPDIILLDVMMPEMSGFEVCEHLKKESEYKDIPVIFLSALTETDSKVKGFSVGGVDYITKPFQRQEVLARIELHVKLKRLQEQLNEKISQLKEREQNLEKLNREKDELIRIVGHDFRNPVTGIMGLASFLEENTSNMPADEQAQMLGIIRESGQKLLDLVNELLTKEENANITELILEELDPQSLMLGVIDLHKPTATNKDITIETDLDDVVPMKLDRHKMEQIVSNLLSNALKFTPEKGTVLVALKEVDHSGRAIDMVIQDSGMGIPEKQLGDLWSSNADSIRTGTSGEEGSGMGLTLVKNFTELHDGQISVESDEGEGTRFTVRLYNQD